MAALQLMYDDDRIYGGGTSLRERHISRTTVVPPSRPGYGAASSFLPSGLRCGVLLHVGGHARSGVGRSTILFALAISRSGMAAVVVEARWCAAAWWWWPAPAWWRWWPGGVRLEVWAWRRR
jgi:hypothetical protein